MPWENISCEIDTFYIYSSLDVKLSLGNALNNKMNMILFQIYTKFFIKMNKKMTGAKIIGSHLIFRFEYISSIPML